MTEYEYCIKSTRPVARYLLAPVLHHKHLLLARKIRAGRAQKQGQVATLYLLFECHSQRKLPPPVVFNTAAVVDGFSASHFGQWGTQSQVHGEKSVRQKLCQHWAVVQKVRFSVSAPGYYLPQLACKLNHYLLRSQLEVLIFILWQGQPQFQTFIHCKPIIQLVGLGTGSSSHCWTWKSVKACLYVPSIICHFHNKMCK